MAMKPRKFRKTVDGSPPGEESFLDIVANLVGVLIILVVVVGVNAGSRLSEPATAEVDDGEVTRLETGLESARRTAGSLLADHRDLEQKIVLEGRLAEQRAQARQQMLVVIESARRKLEAQTTALSSNERERIELAARRDELQRRLREARSGVEALSVEANRRQVIEHFPTPIAKTVFSDEVHFRLREGRLVYVPMNELVEIMRNEWQEKARKLETARQTLETVGPVGDFRLQYQLDVEDETQQTGYGPVSRRTPGFTRFVMVPVRESIGAPLDEALSEDSEFRRRLDEWNPEKTTISVWVYPDSFGEFNRLKQWLYERGFRTACWPLSGNSPISGGPGGYRSTAQ